MVSWRRQFCFSAHLAVRTWDGTKLALKACRLHGIRNTRSMPYCSLPQPSAQDTGLSSVFNANRFENAFIDSNEPMESSIDKPAIPIEFIKKSEWDSWYAEQDEATQAWLKSIRADGWSKNAITTIPSFNVDTIGEVHKVVVPIPKSPSLWTVAAVVGAVPTGRTYKVERFGGMSIADVEIGWALGNYSFTKYKTKTTAKNGENSDQNSDNSVTADMPKLVQNSGVVERTLVESTAAATYMVRDIINTPAEHFGPANLEAACSALASKFGACCTAIVGDQLLRHGYPQVHTVGRAAEADRAPRLIEILWNENANETLTLVGKGVCYDTGGLSVKPTSSMLTMKKDLGGAAQILGLTRMIINHNLNVRLRVLIPAVENCVGSFSYRPGDILTARNGMTTLNMNSDAEGRLILADALAAAAEEKPALIIDCATLTGAQRVALGPEIPAIFCNDDTVADDVCKISREVHDLVWRLPLHKPYKKLLESNIADIKSCGSGPFAGAITAALYLQEFVDDIPWIHMDFMAYNSSSSPGRPEGGEAMGMRSLFHYLHQRFGTS